MDVLSSGYLHGSLVFGFGPSGASRLVRVFPRSSVHPGCLRVLAPVFLLHCCEIAKGSMDGCVVLLQTLGIREVEDERSGSL